jgi:DUF1009 family protein
MSKLGLVAGGGLLPVEIFNACQGAGRPVFVARLRDMADPFFADVDGVDIGVAEFGKLFKAFKTARCDAVCLAGRVSRPDFAKLKPDLRSLAMLPALAAAAGKGDDALLRVIVQEFEREGFRVEGADQIVRRLTLSEGPIGAHAPAADHGRDIDRAMQAARALGALDIGQAAVSVRGVVLAVEAQEGTDAMLRRCADLPAALRGTADAPAGVLAKAPKPIQERRVDLPTIGPDTVMAAAQAGLAGIVGEVGSLLVVDRPAVIAAADELGLFVYGLPPQPPSA